MNKWIIAALAALLTFSVAAQTAREEIAANPAKAGGVYYMYEMIPGEETPAPKGYKPFYIIHYGRHGARYLLSEKEYARVMDIFAKAHEEGALTPKGETLHARFLSYMEQMRYREGELSRYGWDQQVFIAEGMYRAYPALFRQHPKVEAYSTLYIRTMMSMTAFCTALQGLDPSLDLYAQSSRLYLNGICPHLDNNPFKSGSSVRFDIDDPWGGNVERFAAANIDWKPFAARYFSREGWLESHTDPIRFLRWVHTLVFNSTNVPTDIHFDDVLTEEEAYRIWRVENYRYFLGLGPLNTSEISLVKEIVRVADEDMARGIPLIHLRFGHDSSLMAMLSLFGVDTFGQMPSDAEHIEDSWRCYRIPMGCNYRFVCYRDKKGDVLFKFVLNGSDALLPALTPVSGPYYRWTDFKDWIIHRYGTLS